MVSGKIYSVVESDIPNLYNIGLFNLVGKKLKINKSDYYKLILEGDTKKRVPHHIDVNTGKLYEFVPKSDVLRYQNQYKAIEHDLQLAEQGNIKPVTYDQVLIKQEIGNLVNEVKTKEFTNQIVHDDNVKLNKLRLDRTGQSIENALNVATEPIQFATEVVERGADKLSQNVDKLSSSPVFLVALAVGAVVAIKIIF
jgi:hypothetical protein